MRRAAIVILWIVSTAMMLAAAGAWIVGQFRCDFLQVIFAISDDPLAAAPSEDPSADHAIDLVVTPSGFLYADNGGPLPRLRPHSLVPTGIMLKSTSEEVRKEIWSVFYEVSSAKVISSFPIRIYKPYPQWQDELVIGIPYWLVLAVSAPVSLMFSARWVRRRRRLRAGLCANCCYDLSGITGVCPECGTPISVAGRKHSPL